MVCVNVAISLVHCFWVIYAICRLSGSMVFCEFCCPVVILFQLYDWVGTSEHTPQKALLRNEWNRLQREDLHYLKTIRPSSSNELLFLLSMLVSSLKFPLFPSCNCLSKTTDIVYMIERRGKSAITLIAN